LKPLENSYLSESEESGADDILELIKDDNDPFWKN
jgi:hypothetical protein